MRVGDPLPGEFGGCFVTTICVSVRAAGAGLAPSLLRSAMRVSGWEDGYERRGRTRVKSSPARTTPRSVTSTAVSFSSAIRAPGAIVMPLGL